MRPDDISEDHRTWRTKLLTYNESPGDNPLNLLPAYQLYAHAAYRKLVEHFGVDHVFILSAGWGLIPASFLTPHYDISFSFVRDKWKRRLKNDRYEDLSLMPDDGDPIAFLGGLAYQPLFAALASRLGGRKFVFFRSAERREHLAGFEPVRYECRASTNWQYLCARDLIAGCVELPD